MSEQAPSPCVELRLLAGLQAGARMRLAPGQHRLGASDDCDVILLGRGIEEHGATLTWDGDTLRLTLCQLDASAPVTDEGAAQATLALGAPFRLGDLWLCVAPLDSPWPATGSWLAGDAGAAGRVAGPAPPEASAPEVRALPRAVPLAARLMVWVLAASVVVVVSGAAGVWVLMPANAFWPERRPAADPTQLALVLKSLGLESRVQVRTGANGAPMLTGYLSSSSELERLQARLITQGMAVPVQVHLDETTQARVQSLLKGEAWQVLSVHDGAVQLSGPSTHERQRQLLEDRLREAGVPLRSLVLVSASLGQARQRLEALLQEAGLFDRLTLSIENDLLHVRGELPPQALASAQAVFARFNEETGGAVPFSASIDPPPGRLPFQIVQVVGGPAPYFVTEEGDRVLVGGEHRGYRLLSMRDGKMVFSGPQAVEVNW